MFIKRAVLVAGAAGMVAVGLGTATASAAPLFTNGQKTAIMYDNSPLRTCGDTSCSVIASMPKTTSLQPGGGYATFAKDQSGPNWCEINWKGNIGWTGCWRLNPGAGSTSIG